MKRFKLVSLAFAAVVAVCAMTATAALADQWLADGSALAAPLHIDGEGKLDFKLLPSGIGITCTVTSLGTIGPVAADVTETLNILTCTADVGTSCEVASALRSRICLGKQNSY
jgi:hypothetical protein